MGSGAATDRMTALIIHPQIGRRLFVSDYGGGRVLRLDPSSGRTLKRMRVGSEPRDLVLAAGALWVVEQGSSDVRRIPLR